ncbi:dephospho-CoA kinase [Hyphomicrobium sp. NDB2Meth4]|uniref:dephospho-CoA kinase n=1 Tax=Hyphomicrobium sp. NDB2Meth4 TaxID=1892846 RepID=UPI00093170BB|nr:dephospho-CoA kinase [Hyphomicrobium sp. NDB2Meth4]
MLIVGLTGSIGMGKSTAAAFLRLRGVPVFDADAEVHRLYASGKAVERIERAFPGTTTQAGVDRTRLSTAIISHPERLRELEAIVHPMVRESERSFLRAEARRGTQIAVLEIPLLFETNANKLVDVVIVLSAPAEIQRERLLNRVGMTKEKLDGLLARQMPDAEKRARADFVVDTGSGTAASEAHLDKILAELETWSGEAYAREWA